MISDSRDPPDDERNQCAREYVRARNTEYLKALGVWNLLQDSNLIYLLLDRRYPRVSIQYGNGLRHTPELDEIIIQLDNALNSRR